MQPKFSVALILLFFVSVVKAQTPVIDSLKRIIALDKKDSVEVVTYLWLEDEYARSNIAAAKRCAISAVTLSRALNLPIQLSAAYSELATINIQTNQTDSAKYYIGLLKKLASENNALKIISNYNSTAGLYYRKLGDFKSSLPFLIECLRVYTKMNVKLAMAGQTLNVGNDYSDMAEYRKAMTYHLAALKQFEALSNKRGMSFCYSAIGADFIQLGRFMDAMPYIQKSLSMKNELKDKKGIANSYSELGDLEMGLHQSDKALADYLEALALNKTLMLPVEEAKADLSIGRLYVGEKDISNANDYLNRSGEIFKRLGDTVHLNIVNAEEAGLQKNYIHQQKTEKTFLNTLSSSIKTGDKNTEINNYKYLSDFYGQNKQYDKALIYNEKYHAKLDTVQNKELQLQVRGLEQKYNLEREEKEISLLKKDKLLYQVNLKNQELFRYSALIFLFMLVVIAFLVLARYRVVHKARRLIEIEKMRNNIARNLHDDIGSTLSSINILSKVALKQAGENSEVSLGLERIKDSSFTIMESMSDIVWAINPANDPLEKMILKMKEFAAAMLEPAGIQFTFDEGDKLADVKLGVDERKNLYLIFKEAINNIAKYSGGTVANILLHKTNHQFLMKIADNGKGFDNAKQYTGNGLKNMRSRSGEMNAIFEIESDPATGTNISLAIAIA
jgi:two-component system sensor histidine kinase UhpB